MLPYLLKRFLNAIPTLWLIASLVFLLSRLLPGTFASEIILQESGLPGGGSAESRQNAYNDFLRRTGQDLPLFYLSLRAASEPAADIAATVPARQLERLSWHYGDQQAAKVYLESIGDFKRTLLPATLQVYRQQLAQLYITTNAAEIQTLVIQLQPGAADRAAQTAYLTLQYAASRLTQSTTNYSFLIPGLTWHGTRNQYHQWLVQLLQGDMGQSYKDGRAVTSIIYEAVGNTLLILLLSMVLAILIAFYLSLLLVRRKVATLKKLTLGGLFVLDSIPGFVLALLLLVLLANPAFLQAFPVFGLGYSFGYAMSWWQQLQLQVPYLVLPVLCLTLANLPYLTNQLYRSLADASFADYARTAKAKGLSEGSIIRKHLLRNALLPFITLLSDFLPLLVAGAVVVEVIFAIPGMGTLLLSSVLSRDHAVLVAIVVTVATVKVLSHLLADLLYKVADPRIQFNSK